VWSTASTTIRQESKRLGQAKDRTIHGWQFLVRVRCTQGPWERFWYSGQEHCTMAPYVIQGKWWVLLFLLSTNHKYHLSRWVYAARVSIKVWWNVKKCLGNVRQERGTWNLLVGHSFFIADLWRLMPRLLYLRLTSESSFSKLTENENLKNHTSLKKIKKSM
jgi:hypothetical protein